MLLSVDTSPQQHRNAVRYSDVKGYKPRELVDGCCFFLHHLSSFGLAHTGAPSPDFSMGGLERCCGLYEEEFLLLCPRRVSLQHVQCCVSQDRPVVQDRQDTASFWWIVETFCKCTQDKNIKYHSISPVFFWIRHTWSGVCIFWI